MLDCHKCGKRGHVARNYGRPGGDAFDDITNEEVDFPGDDGEDLRRPSCCNEPHIRTLPNGRVVKWYSECGAWGTHLRADHDADTAANIGATGADNAAPSDDDVVQVANVAELGDHSTAEIQTTFARLRAAGIL